MVARARCIGWTCLLTCLCSSLSESLVRKAQTTEALWRDWQEAYEHSLTQRVIDASGSISTLDNFGVGQTYTRTEEAFRTASGSNFQSAFSWTGGDGTGAAFHSMKGGNANRSGYSPFVGPRDLSFPSWTFMHPPVLPKGLTTASMKVFHGSPIIDADYNVYIQSTAGFIYSVDKSGFLRWSFDIVSEDPENPSDMVLVDGLLCTSLQDGYALALDSQTGNLIWQQKIARHGSLDTYSAVAQDGILVIPCNPDGEDYKANLEGSYALCAVSMSDGSEKWTFNLRNYGSRGYKLAPALSDGVLYFSDERGSAYAVWLKDGTKKWYSRTDSDGRTTSGLSIGSDGRVYVGFNTAEGKGTMRCLDLHTGNTIWSKTFKEGVNAVPAVGPLSLPGFQTQMAVIVAVGNNLECLPVPVFGRTTYGQVMALDAETGEALWQFDAPEYSLSCAGNTPGEVCCPGSWTQPTLAADGTVYVNWSGGKLFMMRDENLDGKIDLSNAAEFSYYHHGKGSNSHTAMAPGFMVAGTCDRLLAYTFV
eukprot:TRINITY_DN37902_c0_g1_i1.p1 TRINITY_DN37902_c0_g1~~TRINITY_DN37902_c0_g1_i1.p1  ORF type:complete len:560 (-),score=72.50 TRINITY_DN37902_c0_g1_i1:40-1638(-)